MSRTSTKRIDVFKGDPHRRIGRRWYFHTVAANGQVTQPSQGYSRRRSALIAAIVEARGLPVWVQARRGGGWSLERSGTYSDEDPDRWGV